MVQDIRPVPPKKAKQPEKVELEVVNNNEKEPAKEVVVKTTQPRIYLALAAIIKDVDAIPKDKDNKAQGFKFRGIDDAYNALHPIFAAHGVVCIPLVEKAECKEVGKNKSGGTVYQAQVIMGWKLIASDGSSIRAATAGEGMDSGDKATAKALSVAHKYLLLQMFLIPTADLVDGDYESTVDPKEDLRRLGKEDAARMAVESAVEQAGKPTETAQTAENPEDDEIPGLEKKFIPKDKRVGINHITAWNVESHIGMANGPILGKNMSQLFGPGVKLSRAKKFYAFFQPFLDRQKNNKQPTQQDKDLLEALHYVELDLAKREQEEAIAAENAAAKVTPAVAQADAKEDLALPGAEPDILGKSDKLPPTKQVSSGADVNWRIAKIPFQTKTITGKELGTVGVNYIRAIWEQIVKNPDRYNPEKATAEEKRFAALLAMAISECCIDVEKAAILSMLRNKIEDLIVTEEAFCESMIGVGVLQKVGTGKQHLANYEEDQLRELLRQWPTVEAQVKADAGNLSSQRKGK